MNIFPFYLSQSIADHFYERAGGPFKLRKHLFTSIKFINRLDISVEMINESTGVLRCWVSTDSGYCQTSGMVFNEEVVITPEQAQFWIAEHKFQLAEIEYERRLEIKRKKAIMTIHDALFK
jgi:hypothetical protein